MPSIRVSLTADELTELRRALNLISEADNDADVNMEPAAVKAKDSAARKLAQAYETMSRS